MMIWNSYSGVLNYQGIWSTLKRISRRMGWNQLQTLPRGEPKHRFTASPTSPSKRRRNMKLAREPSWPTLIFLSCSRISADNGLSRCHHAVGSAVKFLLYPDLWGLWLPNKYCASARHLYCISLKSSILLAYIVHVERQTNHLSSKYALEYFEQG